ncbi:hypothetical protein CHISP_3653 [Chitinispirillum alkaliphilum]|nr:hypothetical protein CHISP_3653 [Chitinispirillum alkaliphilum]
MNGYDEKYATIEQESIGELIKDLRDEAFVMVRQQAELIKTEFSEKVSKLTKNTTYLLLGSIVLFCGVLFLLAGLTFLGYVGLLAAGVAPGTAIWLMPLITGVIVGVIGAVMLSKGVKAIKNTSVVPQKTIHSLKEDQQWLKQKRK